MRYQNLLYCFFLLCTPVMLHAQEQKVYAGTVSDSLHPIPAANVFIVNAESVLVSFALTNEQGNFQLTLSKTLMQQPLWIEATCMGYKKERIKFDPEKQRYAFTLTRESVFLKEVRSTTVRNFNNWATRCGISYRVLRKRKTAASATYYAACQASK